MGEIPARDGCFSVLCELAPDCICGRLRCKVLGQEMLSFATAAMLAKIALFKTTIWS